MARRKELDATPVLASELEAPVLRDLEEALNCPGAPLALIGGTDGRQVPLPASICRMLAEIVHELAAGNAVAVASLHRELTTQQAADLLNVSRPFLIGLLEGGAIPFHWTGAHRRVNLRDLLAYRHERSARRRTALAELTRDSQDLGLYD